MSLGLRGIVGAVAHTAADEAGRFAPATRVKQAMRAAGVPPAAAGGPILILSIANGAGHTRAAQAVAAAITREMGAPAPVIDVADHMDALTRFTHVTAYLWLVRHAPAVWGHIDRYQKRQPHTSPEWYYRRGCRSLFRLARKLRPRALVATEVGCCEIGALLKRDLALDAPLVAVNVCYDADRAWVQPEVDLYTVMTERFGAYLAQHGAPPERIAVWGAPLPAEFGAARRLEDSRAQVCRWLGLDEKLSLVMLAGGGEGLGPIEAALARLLARTDAETQFVVLAGRNVRLRGRCERLVKRQRAEERVRVLGWVEAATVARLMRACDLLVSKLGNTFDEAIAAELPLVALEPPPGSERAQYELLEAWGTGRAVRTLDELSETVCALLADEEERARLRARCRARRPPDAARRIARWLAAREQSVAREGAQRSG